MAAEWRLLDDGVGPGALNMGVDRALQLLHAEGEIGPVLRLYGWSVPTVTLGRFQSSDAVDSEVCAELGVDVVRRPTGGRGVLHDDEVTYAFIGGVRDGIPRGTLASYRTIGQALLRAFDSLGVPAEVAPRSRGSGSPEACYLAANQADLSVGPLKLSGSAQVWEGETVLQHGSFVLTRDLDREARVFRLDADAAAKLASTTLTLETATGSRPESMHVRDAIARAFESTFGVRLRAKEVSHSEQERAGHLSAEYVVTRNL